MYAYFLYYFPRVLGNRYYYLIDQAGTSTAQVPQRTQTAGLKISANKSYLATWIVNTLDLRSWTIREQIGLLPKKVEAI